MNPPATDSKSASPGEPLIPPAKALGPILVVDDEKDNLDALKRLLRQQFEVTTTTSPLDALKLLTKQKFQIIVSDQRMPEMTGVELLEKAKSICPETVRILLTGYTDVESVIGAINRGNIYRYVAKPWDPEDLKITLRQASEAFQLRRELEEKNEQLRRNLVALEAVDRAKARFLSLVSHELKTPLTVLNSFIELLSQSKADFEDDLQKAVVKLGTASWRFSEVINEVLAFVRLEGEPTWDLTTVGLLEETLAVKSDLKASAEKKQVTLSVKPLAQPQIRSVREPLREALKRLLTDAIQKAPPGTEVKVTISANPEVSWLLERQGVLFEERAFEPFEVLGNLLNHHRDLGLNLAIARMIFERLAAKTSLDTKNKSSNLKVVFPEAQ